MANFFDVLFGNAPQDTYNPLSPQQGLSQSYGILQGLLPQYTTLNQQKALADAATQQSVEAQIYGPQANQLRQGLYQMGLDQLNMGENLSPALEADLTRKIMEARGQAGTGATQLGAESGIYELALQRELRGQQRRAEARGLTSMLPTSNFQYQPTSIPDVGGIYGQLQIANQNQNAFDNYQRQQAFQGEMDKYNAITSKIGMIGGAATGSFAGPLGTVMGAQTGSQLGGSLFGRGAQQQAGQQGGFNSLLQGLVFNKMMGGIGTPGFNPGFGQPGMQGYVPSSITARPV